LSIVTESPCTIDGVEAVDHCFTRTTDGAPTIDGRQVVIMFPVAPGRQARDLLIITALVPADAPAEVKHGVDALIASLRLQPM
jgi:hypothetical protein